MDFGYLEGSITYGLIPYGKAPHPLPVFRFDNKLIDCKTLIDIKTDSEILMILWIGKPRDN